MGMVRRPANKQATYRTNFNQGKNVSLGKSSTPGTKFNWFDKSKRKSGL